MLSDVVFLQIGYLFLVQDVNQDGNGYAPLFCQSPVGLGGRYSSFKVRIFQQGEKLFGSFFRLELFGGASSATLSSSTGGIIDHMMLAGV